MSAFASPTAAQTIAGPTESQRPVQPIERWPRVGGHWGIAVPIAFVSNGGNGGSAQGTVIGRDFATGGIAPGVTVKINPYWAIDFEFVAYSRWNLERGSTPASVQTSFVLDPGIVWTPGPVAVGLRGAVQVGANVPFNVGIIPIINRGIDIGSRMRWFFELDLPLFVQATPANQTVVSFGAQLQTGVAF